jgi:hypothetical protein
LRQFSEVVTAGAWASPVNARNTNMPEYEWKIPHYRCWDLNKRGAWVGNLVIVKGCFMGRIGPNTEWTQIHVKLLREAKAALIKAYEESVKPDGIR